MNIETGRFLHTYLVGAWKIARLYELHFAEDLKKYGLTKSEKDVLLFLYNNPLYDKAADIVEYRSISKALVSKSVDSLTDKGYIQTAHNPEDKRYIRLILTEKSIEVLKILSVSQNNFFKDIRKDFSDEEYNQLMALSDKILSNVEESLEKYE